MKLPNGSRGLVEQRKVVDYLLNGAHPDNGGKAAFFGALGFSTANPGDLIAALTDLAGQEEVVAEVASSHGRKYVVDGSFKSAAGKSPIVRTIWIIDLGGVIPRLVTAYPGED